MLKFAAIRRFIEPSQREVDRKMVDVDFKGILNWLGLGLSVALTIYGVIGLRTGSVKASSYAFLNNEKKYTGTQAKVLSISWIVFGVLGTVAFGGFLLKIKELMPFHDFVFQMLSVRDSISLFSSFC